MAVTALPDALEAGCTPGMVRIEGLRFAYGGGPPVLDGLDLEIRVGEIVALAGPQGSGKSTLLRILAGELRPASGALELPARQAGGGRLMLGYGAGLGVHFERLSGRRNALFFAKAAGMRSREAEASVSEHLTALGLADLADRPVSEYGFGARRKLVLVEAVAHRPALTLLDDPFLGLDQPAREALIGVLRLQAAKRGTVVVASRDLTLIPELADRLVFLHGGRVAAQGRVAELLASVGPETRFEVQLDRKPQRLEARFRAGIRVVSDGDPFVFETSRGQAAVGEVVGALVAAGAVIKSVTVREPDLAEAFRRATGVELGA